MLWQFSILTILGAEYEEFLTPHISVLICKDPNNVNAEKIRYALEWDIPAVSADWLWISVQTGERKPFDQYCIPEYKYNKHKSERELSARMSEHQMDESTRRVTDKGKEPSAGIRTSARPLSELQDKKGERYTSKREQSTDSRSLLELSLQRSKSTTPNVTRDTSASKSPSPPKVERGKREPMISNKSDEPSNNTSSKATTDALDRAVTGFLRQARALSNLSNKSVGSVEKIEDQPTKKRRKRLLGRAGSLSSTRKGNGPLAVSRASSIDTLNEDGYGSAIEGSGNADINENESTRRHLRNGLSFNSIISGNNRTDLYVDAPLYDQNDEDQKPAMTQLDYEDPDAAAMRRELLGQPAIEDATSNADGSRLARESLTDDMELKDIGREPWGTGRRTRRSERMKEADRKFP